MSFAGTRLSLKYAANLAYGPYDLGGTPSRRAADAQTLVLADATMTWFTENFVPGFDAESWLGLAAPRGTPDDVIMVLNKAANQAMANPKIRDQLLAMGTRPVGGPPQQFTGFVENQVAMWKKVIATAGIQPQ